MIVLKGTREFGLFTKFLVSIVDDDESSREAITSLMKSARFAVEAFPSAEEFLASPYLRSTYCLVSDINMPGMTGLELHSHLVQSGYAIPTILITAYPDERVRDRALAMGIICYLSKPCDEDTLIKSVLSALQQARPP